ncbi:hypothetical protein ACQP1O_18850 [Nocardia sp. CA-151230]|uniref:hypothetical protein n=1 Tax=Nocardia sp. CA-151230 TaxID=3239982 RepID=UPI003D93B581
MLQLPLFEPSSVSSLATARSDFSLGPKDFRAFAGAKAPITRTMGPPISTIAHSRVGRFEWVDLAGRYSKRTDLQKLESARAKIDTGRPSTLPRQRKKRSATKPREPRRIERRLTSTTVDELIQAYADGSSTAQLVSCV